MRQIPLLLIGFFCAIPLSWSQLLDMGYERLPYPSVRQVLTEDFLKHSEQYLHWVTQEHEKKLKTTPDSLPIYLELSQAYLLNGMRDSAKHVLEQAAERFPDTSQVWMGLAWWEFGEGHYPAAMETLFRGLDVDSITEKSILRQRIFEYAAIQFPIEDTGLPLQGVVGIDELTKRRKLEEIPNFYTFIKADWQGYTQEVQDSLLNQSIAELVDLLWREREGKRRLLEMLGDLLLAKGSGELAAVAYLQAARGLEDESIRRMYRYIGTEALLVSQKTGIPFSLQEVQIKLKAMLEKVAQFHAEVRKNEKFWIESGANPHQEFLKKYVRPNALNDSLPAFRPAHMELVLQLSDKFTDYLLIDQVRKEEVLTQLQEPEENQEAEEETATDETEPALRRTQWILVGVMLGNLLLAGLLFWRYGTQTPTKDSEPA